MLRPARACNHTVPRPPDGSAVDPLKECAGAHDQVQRDDDDPNNLFHPRVGYAV